MAKTTVTRAILTGLKDRSVSSCITARWYAEDILRSSEVGKPADFVVIPIDHMTIAAEDIWKIIVTC
jgi:hypothetical protein